MKYISVDMRMINHSGIGTYIKNLIPLVMERCPNYHFNLLGSKPLIESLPLSNLGNFDIISCESSIYSLSEQIEMIRKIPPNNDLLWIPHFNIPLLYKGKMMVTIHDLFFLAMPHLVEGNLKKWYAKVMYNSVRRKAGSILCNSNFTRGELLRYTKGISDYNVHAVHLGLNPLWFTRDDEVSKESENPYILFVGNVKPHKNIKSLIYAFESLLHDIPHRLVIVGKKEGFISGDQEVGKLAEKLGNRVTFTGFVSDKDLKTYYSKAAALVMPSYYEGFGFPPLEAMAAGCPVVVSNNSSMPEICQDGALYCDPTDTSSIASAIAKVVENNSEVRTYLVERGKQLALFYSWERCADLTVDVLHKTINQK